MKKKILIFCLSILSLLVVAYVIISIRYAVPDISDQDVHLLSNQPSIKEKYNSGIYQFPDEQWLLYPRPIELGWSESILSSVGRKADSLETAALMVIHKGVLVYDWGLTNEKYLTQSMRKGLLNSLYGVYWDKGIIDLDSKLSELNIDDVPPLMAREKQASIRQLLQSTSGVYHSALYELGEWKRGKPVRGSHAPGETWYYNNWGFNALGTIFEKASGESIGDAFYSEIAEPLAMQDFEREDVAYITAEDKSEKFMDNFSEHDAYMFSTSARDMARYGLLYLNKGKWQNEQIISEEWIEQSWEPVNVEVYGSLKFGYLWWMFEGGEIFINYDAGFEGTIYFTSGNRGHFVFVIPYLDLVVVHRVHVKGVDFMSQMKRGMLGMYADVDDTEVYFLLEMIRKAHPRYSRQ